MDGPLRYRNGTDSHQHVGGTNATTKRQHPLMGTITIQI